MMYGDRSEIIAIIVLIVLLAIIGGVLYDAWQSSKETELEQCIYAGNHCLDRDQCGHCWPHVRNTQRTTLWQYVDYPVSTETTRPSQIGDDSSLAAYRLWQRRIMEKRGVEQC